MTLSSMLFSATLTGGVACAFLLLLKGKLLAALGGRWYYRALILAMLLFLVPIRIPITHTAPVASVQQETPQDAVGAGQAEAGLTASIPAKETDPAPRPIVTTESVQAFALDWRQLLVAAWLTGVVFTLTRYFTSYFRFRKRALSDPPAFAYSGLPIHSSEAVSSPMLIGFFKPHIVLPRQEELNEDTLTMALRHEYCHYRGKDAWVKLAAVIVQAIHWFNPVSHFLVRGIGETCEYACDERVSRDMSLSEKQQYGRAMLSFVSAGAPALSSSLARQQKGLLRRRIEHMMGHSKKRQGLGALLVSGVVALAMLVTAVAFAETQAPLNETNGGYHTSFIGENWAIYGDVTVMASSGTIEDNVLRQLYTLEEYREIASNPGTIFIENADDVNFYIGDSGKHIAVGNKEEVALAVNIGWRIRNEETQPLIQKELEICGRTVYVGFTEEALPYADHPVIEAMVRTQIQYELEGYQPEEWGTQYDHSAYVDALIDQGIYMVNAVAEPQDLPSHLLSLGEENREYFWGWKVLTRYDAIETRTLNIFSGTVNLAANVDGNQGVQLGEAFSIAQGEVLTIDLKNAEGMQLNIAVVNADSGETVTWTQSDSGYRYTFMPTGSDLNGARFCLRVSGVQSGKAPFDVYTHP